MLGLATSCRRIPKKLPIKVSKSCRKVAKIFLLFVPFLVLKIKNSHIASYQNFICQSPMIISEVLSILLDQQIVYQNDMNKTWLYTHIMFNSFHVTCCLTLFQYEIHSRMTDFDDVLSSNNDILFLWFWL